MGTIRDGHRWSTVGRFHFECIDCGVQQIHVQQRGGRDPRRYLVRWTVDDQAVRIAGDHPFICGGRLSEYRSAPLASLVLKLLEAGERFQ